MNEIQIKYTFCVLKYAYYLYFFKSFKDETPCISHPRFRALRLLRSFRALRLVSHLTILQNVVGALADSLSAVSTVFVLITFIWLVFAILGVHIFAGKMWVCR